MKDSEVQAAKWKEALSKNKYLLHLDISGNGFTAREVEVIAEGLSRNHKILGVHLMGNQAEINSLGFVR